MAKKDIDTFCPASQRDWRAWLEKHHNVRQSVWLVCYKKETNRPSITHSQLVDEALCFGWIDSTRKSAGDGSFMQFMSRRKPTSTWSKVNKDKVDRLVEAGLMMPAGQACIDIAKQNGSWETLNPVDALTIPKDLAKGFRSHPGSRKYFLSLSNSAQKAILQWLVLAKRPETREKRITEIAALAAQHLKPKQFR